MGKHFSVRNIVFSKPYVVTSVFLDEVVAAGMGCSWLTVVLANEL